MATRRRAAPPTGLTPPREATGPAGDTLDLVALAAAVCVRYYDHFTDEDEIWGPAGRAWCQHDLQHLLNWAAESVEGFVDLDREVAWLAGVLEARDFEIARLAASLDMAADVVRAEVAEGEPMAAALAGSAAMIRERGTFL